MRPSFRRAVVLSLAAMLDLTPANAHTWVPGPPGPITGPVARARTPIAFDSARGRLVVFGGDTILGWTNETWENDGTAWVRGPAAPPALTARVGHAMAYDAFRGRMVMFGGSDASGYRNDTWYYDGSSWTQGAPAPAGLTPRRIYAMAHDAARGRSVIFGGVGPGTLDETWEHDGIGWSLVPTSGGPVARFGHALAYDARRQVTVLFGGEGAGRLDDTWEWDGASWMPGPTGPSARYGVSMAYDERRLRMVLVGGDSGGRDVWEYDGASWASAPAPPAGVLWRFYHFMAYDGLRQRTVVYGGYGSSNTVNQHDDLWTYDGTSWLEGPRPGPSLTPRDALAMVFDVGRGRLVLYGGDDGSSRGDDRTWECDGASWAPSVVAPAAMSTRSYHAMVWDSGRGRSVLFGGVRGRYGPATNDTWEYDGIAWSPGPAAPAGLVARSGHAMAYDSGRARTVLFGGGLQTGTIAKDTWEYDGTSWSLALPPQAEPWTRFGHAMTYDTVRRRVVMFGGYSAYQSARVNDTWEFDGTQWSRGPVAPPELTARDGHGMAFDPDRGLTVLAGGMLQGGTGYEAWEYDGIRWVAGGGSGAFYVRSGFGMAYDSLRGRVVVFGGSGPLPPQGLRNDSLEYVPGEPNYLTGAGLGPPNPNRVRIFDAGGAPTSIDFAAYGAGQWGVNVSAADLRGSLPEGILTGPGPGPIFGPQARGFDATGGPIGRVNFYAYGTLKYGVNVASGETDGDGFGEILTGAGPGDVFGPHVRGFDFDNAALAAIPGINLYAYGTLKFGVNVTHGEVDADGFDELLTGPGPGVVFDAVVRGFDVDAGPATAMAKIGFDAFGGGGFGASVACGGYDTDAFDEIAVAHGPGASLAARLRGFDFDGASIAVAPGFDVTPFTTGYGARPGVTRYPGAGREALLAGAGSDPAADSTVLLLFYSGSSMVPYGVPFQAFPGTAFGVNVTAGPFGY